MRIFIQCKDVMLQKTMELFLKDYLCAKKECDFVICDENISYKKPQFIISEGKNLNIPFSKEKLFEKINEFYQKIIHQNDKKEQIETIEIELEKILDDFKVSVLNLFKKIK